MSWMDKSIPSSCAGSGCGWASGMSRYVLSPTTNAPPAGTTVSAELAMLTSSLMFGVLAP
jgi:hypothetical protein